MNLTYYDNAIFSYGKKLAVAASGEKSLRVHKNFDAMNDDDSVYFTVSIKYVLSFFLLPFLLLHKILPLL